MKTALRAAAVLIVLILLPDQGATSGMTPRDPEETPAATKKDPATVAKESSSLPVRGREDPFAPLKRKSVLRRPPDAGTDGNGATESPPARAGKLHLEGIIWSPGNPQAVINETLVGTGEEVAGWTVLSIGREDVVLEFMDRRITLNMDAHAYAGDKKPELPKE